MTPEEARARRRALKQTSTRPRSMGTLERQNSLPAELSSFVGRVKQLDDLAARLRSVRLLTLTGVGGVGKTRLALRLARTVEHDYPDGVWLVELAPLADGGLLDATVASRLGMEAQPGRSPVATLADALRSRRLLLILDNCEHVLAAAASLAGALLQACPEVRILATSREPLRVPGENVWRVPPLSLPPVGGPSRVDAVVESEAVQLFCRRAEEVDRDFSLTDRDIAAVATVCRELDGIPLAIELAAARAEMFSVEQIAVHLSDHFRLISNTSRTAAPRHQTLRAVVAWSYELLDARPRHMLANLSIFAGGWTLEAAEAVTATAELPRADVAAVLGQLIAASLVEVEARDGNRRYRLLETIREFGAEQLRTARDEGARCRTLHRDWFLALAGRLAQSIPGPDETEAMDVLESELENLRVALDSCSIDPEGVEPGLRVAGQLWWFWFTRNHWTEARVHLERLLSQPTARVDSAGRAYALFALGGILRGQGEFDAARVAQHESLAIQRALGDRLGEAFVLSELGRVVRALGELDSAQAILEESLTLFEQLHHDWGVARQLSGLGQIARMRGDLARAQELCAASLGISRAMQDRMGIWIDLLSLGWIAYLQRDADRAARLLHEGLTLQRELRTTFGVLDSIQVLAGVALRSRQPERAARLFGAADRLGRSLAFSIDWQPAEREESRRDIAVTRGELGDAAFRAAWAEGCSWQLEEAIDFALAAPLRRRRTRPNAQAPGVLSAREMQVARLVAQGLSNRQIAERLVITERTAGAHVEHILDKLQVNWRTQIGVWAAAHLAHEPDAVPST